MIRSSLAVLAILVCSCTATAETLGSPASVGGAEREITIQELSRRVDTCNGDPAEFLAQRDYCMGIGPWQSARPSP